MDNIRVLLSRLSSNLATIKAKVRMENSTNDMSLNVLLETKILGIYNISKGLNLENSNLSIKNSPGVDGIDEENKVMAQVTSTFSTQKIEHTVKEVLQQKLHVKFTRLIFIIISDKRKISDSFKKKINQLIDGRFNFDFDNDIIDLNDIYAIHHSKQDLPRIHKIVSLLDEVLMYMPESKESGFGSVSVSYHEHEEEIQNVFYIVDAIIREGKNVYINSKKLYEKFRFEKHPMMDFIIYADTTLTISNIELCIVVLSNGFIYNNFLSKDIDNKCNLFANAIENDIKIETISFDRFLKDVKKIPYQQLRSYQSVTSQNIQKVIGTFLKNSSNESAFSTVDPDEIIEELIQANHNFQVETVHDGLDYILLSFVMEQQVDLEMNYIVVKKDYNLTRLVGDYNTLHKKKYNKNLNILVPKDFQQKTRRRLELVAGKFPGCRVFFVDEHVFDKKYRSLEQKPMLSTKDFITPVVRDGEEFLGINDIIHWIFNNSDSSIAIISGSGGIGKTTISEKIHDTIIDEHERNIVIFIDANKYIEVFKRTTGNSEYDLYRIFKQCHSHANKIDKNSFYLNYALGNIIIIFDGIDEIISTIPTFSLQQFVESLENLRMKIGRGKILINCRDLYINDLLITYRENPEESREDRIKVYQLLGFNEELSNKFFSKHFKGVDKQRLCLRLLNEFYSDESPKEKYQYPPFVLEIVVEIVSGNFNYLEIETGFTSYLLSPDEKNDIFIFRICNREVAKKEDFGFQLSVDKQVQFFCNLAVEEKGEIQINMFDRIISNIGVQDRIQNVAKGLSDHPLLVKTNGSYKFRFNFFNAFFKSVNVFNLLIKESSFELTDRLINVIAYECNYNSVLYKSLISRLSNEKIDSKLIISCARGVFNNIKLKMKSRNESFAFACKKAISNLFLVILKSKINFSNSSSFIIKELFGKIDADKSIISDLYIIDVPSSADIRLDFRGNIYTGVEINNYPNFFKCDFDMNTFFDDICTIENVYNEKLSPKSIESTFANFDRNIKGDNSIFKILSMKDSQENVIMYFKAYLKPFLQRNILNMSLQLTSINFIQHEYITIKLLSEILQNNDIISKFENNEVFLNHKMETKILKFLKQALPFPELNRSIKELKNTLIELRMRS